MPKHSEMTITKRRKKRMCNFCAMPLYPKGEDLDEEMKYDAQQYMAELAAEEAESEEDDE